MPQPPYAKVRAQLNGGAILTGGITATGGEVVQLSADPAGIVGATQYLWELLSFPPAFTLPAGWSADASGNYYSTAQTPPPFTLLTAADFDKYITRLTLNGGGPALTGKETAAQLEAIQALVDETTAIQVLSATGLTQLGFFEGNQFSLKGWAAGIRANIRLLAALIGGGGTGDVVGPGAAVDNRLALFSGTTGKLLKVASILVSDLFLRTGSVAMTGDIDLGTHKGTNAGTPSNPSDLATKSYVDAHTGGGSAGRGFPFTYSTNTTDADPGAGLLRGDNATLASSAHLFIDDVAANGATGMSAWIASFDDQVGAVKGILRVQSASDPTKYIEWPVSGITTASGYSKVALGTAWGPGGIVTTASDTLVSFDAEGVSANLNNQALTNAKGFAYNGEIPTTGATPAVNFSTGDLQKTTLSANATPVFTAPAGIGWVQWHVQQDGTGGRSIAFPGTVAGTPPQPAQGASTHTFYGFFYDGTNYHYIALSHTSLSDLTVGDPHTQYALVDGTRAFTGGVRISQPAKTSGSPYALLVVGGAHTTLAASTEACDLDFELNRTVQFATGGIVTQRAVVVRKTTYAFVGASTITNAATVAIEGAPVAGANATLTNKWALWVQADSIRSDGSIEAGGGTVSTDTAACVRIAYGKTFLSSRNNAGAADRSLVTFGVDGTNLLTLGNASDVSIWLQMAAAGGLNYRYNNIVHYSASAGGITWGGAAAGFTVLWGDTVNSIEFGQQTNVSATYTGCTFLMHSQDVSGGTATTGGAFNRRAGDALGGAGTRNGGHLYDRPGAGASSNGNWGWFCQSGDAINFQSMQGGIYCKNRSAAPAGNPSGGGFLYAEGGALKWLGSSGTPTTIAAA